ncbi:DUF6789 family protein [Allgaiera indica]|nr:DUF6789 family protein [Allgaiera indica]SDW12343.1 hypothetical protein SAMN05444006_101320 [Allgaiera indica]
MQKISAGLGAGFIATVVLSALMVAKAMMGLMPALDVIHMLSRMMGAPAFMGWVAHFAIGTIAWGGAFALTYERIPGNSLVVKGIAFGIAAWFAMMVLVMPMAGAGLFGLSLGVAAPVMTLLLHIVYGAVLGAAFGFLTAPRALHP